MAEMVEQLNKTLLHKVLTSSLHIAFNYAYEKAKREVAPR
jgi:hypothetical protein